MEKKPVNQVIQEHKETVRTYIERVIDRDMEGKPGYVNYPRLKSRVSAPLFDERRTIERVWLHGLHP